MTLQVLAANNLTDGYVRPIAWRGSEMLAVSAQQTTIHLAIAAWPWPSYFGAERMAGIRLGMAPWKRPSPETAPTASKATGLYMIGTMSKHAAEEAGYNDALMLDWRGYVSEGTGANVFLVLDGDIHTPTPDCFLDGITRQVVEELAARRGFSVHRRSIEPGELISFEEAFLCGTAAEIAPIATIGEVRFKVGPSTSLLIDDFTALTAAPGE